MSFLACARSCCSAVEPDGAEAVAGEGPEPAAEGGAVAGVVAAVDGLELLPHPASSQVAAMTRISATLCHLGTITAPDPTRRGRGTPDGCLATTTNLHWKHVDDDSNHGAHRDPRDRCQPRADPD